MVSGYNRWRDLKAWPNAAGNPVGVSQYVGWWHGPGFTYRFCGWPGWSSHTMHLVWWIPEGCRERWHGRPGLVSGQPMLPCCFPLAARTGHLCARLA